MAQPLVWFVLQAKIVRSTQKAAESDLELFNREKQQKLNELDVVVPLRLHQVCVCVCVWVCGCVCCATRVCVCVCL